MSAAEFGSFSLLLFLLISVAHVFGHLFTRLGQPRVVGEILAGVVIGPSVLGQIAPALSVGDPPDRRLRRGAQIPGRDRVSVQPGAPAADVRLGRGNQGAVQA